MDKTRVLTKESLEALVEILHLTDVIQEAISWISRNVAEVGYAAEKIAHIMRKIDDNLDLVEHKIQRYSSQATRYVCWGILYALLTLLELYDKEARGHAERVMRYSLAIGRKLGLFEDQLDALARGALLHDIGRIGICEDSLGNHDVLARDKQNDSLCHVLIGDHLVNCFPFLSDISPIIRHHYERYDGQGFPDGLYGEKIPLLARIVSVANALDEMTWNPTGGVKELTIKEALDIIQQEEGRRFCPTVIRALIQISQDELEEMRRKPLLPVTELFADFMW